MRQIWWETDNVFINNLFRFYDVENYQDYSLAGKDVQSKLEWQY